jgi:hypothetical protein
MTDVWDLTDKDKGDHVLIALTVAECKQALFDLGDCRSYYQDDAVNHRVMEEIRRSLRDQKDIDA